MEDKEVIQILVELSDKNDLEPDEFIWPHAWGLGTFEPDYMKAGIVKKDHNFVRANKNYLDFILFFAELPGVRYTQLIYDCLCMPLVAQITYCKWENVCKIFSSERALLFKKTEDTIVWQIMPSRDALKLIKIKQRNLGN